MDDMDTINDKAQTDSPHWPAIASHRMTPGIDPASYHAVMDKKDSGSEKDGVCDSAPRIAGADAYRLADAIGVADRILEGAEGAKEALDGLRSLATKYCGDMPVMEAQPFGGAVSFGEMDAWREASDQEWAIRDLSYQFDAIVRNIWADEEKDVTEKAKLIAKAASDLDARLGKGSKSLLNRITDRLTGAKVTKRDGGVEYEASDYADVPDADKPSTWKLRLAEDRSGNITVAQVGRAITALQPGGFRGQEVELGQPRETVIGKIRRAIGKIEDATDEQRASLRKRLNAVKEGSGAIKVFKDATGAWRYIAVYSNNFYDKDGEVFPEAAHLRYVAKADGLKQYPELWLWHVKGSRLGQADMVDYVDGFMLATGRFDKGMERAAERLAAMPDLAMSHGYYYEPTSLRNGVYGDYWTFEKSILPDAAIAANEGTAFLADKEVPMFNEEKRAFLTEVLGDEKKVADIESRLEALGKELTEKGIGFKDVLTGVGEASAVAEPGKPDGAGATTDPPADGADALAGLKAAVTEAAGLAIKEALAPLATRMETVEAAIAELRKSDDEKVETLFTARSKVHAGKAASESADNIVPDEAAKKLKEALGGDGDDHPANGIVKDILAVAGYRGPAAGGTS